MPLASPRPVLLPLSVPGGQKTASAPRSSGPAPTSVGQLVMSASAGPKPPAVTSGPALTPTALGQLVMSASAGPTSPPATLGPGPMATSRNPKQVPPATTGPKPARAASGLSLALTPEEQPSRSPSSSPLASSPALSPSQEKSPVTSVPVTVGHKPLKQREAHLQPPEQASGPVGSPPLIQSPPDPRLSPSFRARPEVPRSSTEESGLPRPPQTLALDGRQGALDPGTRSPGLLSPTFRPGGTTFQTVPPPLPKPPRSPSRSPSRSPNRSPCVPPTPETTVPRPGIQGTGPAPARLSPSLQPREIPVPVTSSPPTTTATSSSSSSSSASSSWSAQPTCKNDPGFW